jgi:hypothetical protein
MLRSLDPGVIKILGSVLSPAHIRRLSDEQFQSKEFPGAEIAAIIKQDPKKLEEYFPTYDYSYLPHIKKMLQLLHPSVFDSLRDVLSHEHLKLAGKVSS